MDVEYISPFISSVSDMFSSMLFTSAHNGDMVYETNGFITDALNASVELTGSISGIVGMTLPAKTGIQLINTLLAMELTEVDEMVLDGISEMLNIVAGGAKANLPTSQEQPIRLGIPISFQNDSGAVPTVKEWTRIPFNGEWGSFNLWISFEIA